MGDTVNTIELIKRKFEEWDVPMGDFFQSDDITKNMARFADYLGDEHADDFVKGLLWMMENNFSHLGVVYEFYEIYTQKYSSAIATALMRHITPESPPLLVEILGSTNEAQAIDFLANTIDLATAGETLLIACISAIGELGGDKAVALLQNISQMRGNNISAEAMEELEIAILNNKNA